MNPFTLRPFRIDVAALHDWNRRNQRSIRAYHASQTPDRPALYACTGCARDTKSRTGKCRDCERMSA